MAYIGVSPSNGVRQKHTYTATASQTTFSGAGAEGVSLSYRDSNYVDVYVNGVKLGDADYTATSNTSIVLGEGAAVNDIVEIVVYDVFSVADTVSKADGGTFDGNVTMAGTLAVTGETTLSANLNLGDNDKAIFGASNPLEIYHDGSNKYIQDTGGGSLFIRGSDLVLEDDGGNDYITMSDTGTGGTVTLKHNAASKLATTSTGIDVTGTATMDGLTVDGDAKVDGLALDGKADASTTYFRFRENASAFGFNGTYIEYDGSANNLIFGRHNISNTDTANDTPVMSFQRSTGDISFYEDTGTTAKLFWDASAESLGIGTSNPSSFNGGANNLVVGTGSGSEGITIYADNSSNSAIFFADTDSTTTGQINYQHASNAFSFHTNGGTERMRIDSSGRVGIITSSPSTYLEIGRDGQAAAINSTYHKDTFASMLITGNEARLQIAASDGGSDSAMLLISSGTNNWAVRANGPSAGNRFAIGYNSSSSDGNIGSYGTLTKGIEIETNGAVTMPNQPAFMVHKGTAQVNIARNASTTITFNNENFDNNSDFASSTFTAPVTGKYQLNVSVRVDEVDDVTQYTIINLVTSNRTIQLIHGNSGYDADVNYMSISGSHIVDMDANDSAFVQINLPSLGTTQLDINGETRFSGFLVC